MKTPRLTAAIVFRVSALFAAAGTLDARGMRYLRREGGNARARRAFRAAARMQWQAHKLMRESLSAHEQWLLIELFAADDRNREALARKNKAKAA